MRASTWTYLAPPRPGPPALPHHTTPTCEGRSSSAPPAASSVPVASIWRLLGPSSLCCCDAVAVTLHTRDAARHVWWCRNAVLPAVVSEGLDGRCAWDCMACMAIADSLHGCRSDSLTRHPNQVYTSLPTPLLKELSGCRTRHHHPLPQHHASCSRDTCVYKGPILQRPCALCCQRRAQAQRWVQPSPAPRTGNVA